MNRFQILLSNSTCGATRWATQALCALAAVLPSHPAAAVELYPGAADAAAVAAAALLLARQLAPVPGSPVGRCRLTVSKPVLKVPMISELEAKI
jgi:hypothetical protein